jgi:GTPase Era involved in 16S rRNA processing
MLEGRSTLQVRAEQLIQQAIEDCAPHAALAPLRRELAQAADRLRQPMQVAVVGLIKAGKSTLMNALLGQEVLPTGAVETTFNVNWLRYAERPGLTVHFKDGRLPETRPFEDLSTLTKRADENRASLLSIKYVQVGYPNSVLKTFDLIDTPGLASQHKDDSQNTKEFLNLHGKELTEVTKAESSTADAVLYLFSQGLAAADDSIIEEFLGPAMGRATPINSIGVLTKVDYYAANPQTKDPMEAGRRINARLSKEPRVRQLFYALYPVCGLLALGAQAMEQEEFDILTRLAALPRERLDKLLRDLDRLTKDYPNEPQMLSAAERKRALGLLGQYGVALGCARIRDGASDLETLKRELLQYSGFPELRDLIVRHFGNRAFLIKLGKALRQIEAACFQARKAARSTGSAVQNAMDKVANDFDRFKEQEHAFRELEVLRLHYERKLDFGDEEEDQLLAVTGEYGTSCSNRLGLSETAGLDDMLGLAAERIVHWRVRANDSVSSDRWTVFAAEVLARSFERIAFRVRRAKEYLFD